MGEFERNIALVVALVIIACWFPIIRPCFKGLMWRYRERRARRNEEQAWATVLKEVTPKGETPPKPVDGIHRMSPVQGKPTRYCRHCNCAQYGLRCRQCESETVVLEV